MKNSLTILLLLFCLRGFSADYYFSNAGNDGNAGTQASPYATITKFNSITKVAGDRFYFKRGDTFYGSITVNQSGTQESPIVIGAYGTGAKPIITGFTSVSSWANLGGNIWESTSAVSTLDSLNIVLINGKNTAMGRYPNSGWFPYQNHIGKTAIISSSINSATTDWTGASVVLKKNRWSATNGRITKHSGDTLIFTDSWIGTPTDGYGFFIQDDARTLDVQNEWFYNRSTKLIRIYSTTSPAGVQVSGIANLLVLNGDYITVQNIELNGANEDAITSYNNTNITIDSCVVAYAGQQGIIGQSSTNTIIRNCWVHHCNSNGIRFQGNAGLLIEYNTVNSTSIFPGLMKTYNFGAICINDGATVQYNNVDSSGYNGIMLNGRTDVTVKNNFVNNSCLTFEDGGGIYTSNAGTNTVISNNIILNSKGNAGGNPDTDNMAFGIYLDSYVASATIQGNTISGCGGAGGFFSNDNDILVRDNTFYNNSVSSGFAAKSEVHLQHICCNLVRNNDFYNNIYFSGDASKYSIFFYSITDDVPSFGLADSNYFANPLAAIGGNFTSVQVNSTTTNRTVSQWSTYTGQDVHSQVAPYFSKLSSDIRFEYNATNSPKTVPLDFKYIDAKSTEYNTGIITLQPYTSAVLIKNGALSVIPPPIVSAGPDQIIDTSITNLVGTAIPASGQTITSTVWSKVSGGTVGILNAGSDTAQISGMVPGEYVFQFKVTQSDGQIVVDFVKVTVNINQPPVIEPISNQTLKMPGNWIILENK